MWVYSSLLVYLVDICFIFSGQLNLTSEKLLCSVPMLSEVLFAILQRHWLDAWHSTLKFKTSFCYFYTIKGMRISISGITEVLELTSIHLFRFQAIYKNGDENYIVHSCLFL